MIGYPKGYYDDLSLYPIIKSGIIASRWGSNFENNRYFLIDAKLLPGSSGSVVVSKPTNLVVDDGVRYSKEKQFAFLGIYSGQKYMIENPIDLDDMTITRKISFDLGIVWYADLVEEIIEDGIPISKVMNRASLD